jgi:hypothetical protein
MLANLAVALMGLAMRHLPFLFFVLGILWAVDTFRFDGRYSSVIWVQANDLARSFNYDAQRFVQRLTGR